MNRFVNYERPLTNRFTLRASALGTLLLTAASMPLTAQLDDYPRVTEFTIGSEAPPHTEHHNVRQTYVQFSCEPDAHECTPHEAIQSVGDEKDVATAVDFFEKFKNEQLIASPVPLKDFVAISPKSQVEAANKDGRLPFKQKRKTVEASIGDPVTCEVKNKTVATSVEYPGEQPTRIPVSFLPIPMLWIKRRKKASTQVEPEVRVQSLSKSLPQSIAPKTMQIPDKADAVLKSSDYGDGYGYPFYERFYDRWPRLSAILMAGVVLGSTVVGAQQYYEHEVKHTGCDINIKKEAHSWNPHISYVSCDSSGKPIPPQPVVEQLALKFDGCDNVSVAIPGISDRLVGKFANRLKEGNGFFDSPRLPQGQQALNQLSRTLVDLHNKQLPNS